MSRTNTVRVGVLGGTRLPGNVSTFLDNIRRLLKSSPVNFRFDLLLRRDAIDRLSGFNIVDPGIKDTNRAIRTFWTLTAATTRYARQYPVDVLLQVTKFPIHGFAATIAGRLTATPIVTRFAGDNFREHLFADGIADRMRTLGLNNLLGTVPVRLSDATIVLGPHGRNEIKKRNDRADVRVISQPVNFEQFQPVSEENRERIRKKLGMPSDERVLLTVGRISERKGMCDLMTAAQSLADSETGICWYVAGDGPLQKKLEQIPLVEPLGRVPHDNMPDYYRAADLVVHPSLIEGLPNVLLEAAACGTPTISRDVGDAAIAASKTYDDSACLPDLVLSDYEPVDLGPQFSQESLRKNYAEVLIDVATRNDNE